MNVITFYSFRGGLGRTMALVNVATELAKGGKRVLLVDFDLESPSLDAFPLLRPKAKPNGVVDFVLKYIRDDRAPNVEDFTYLPRSYENLCVMPAGLIDETYARKVAEIDWPSLYGERDGFLLFEDLKEQWRHYIKPDYVLIDSSTGFKASAGICTRQLPDKVFILFFPNEQHLRGLKKVVSDVRAEARTSRAKQIELHFVMANTTDLDDEDSILGSMKERFQEELDFCNEPSVIHRYESLALLKQSIFSVDRPRSRLAKEYGALVALIADSSSTNEDSRIHPE